MINPAEAIDEIDAIVNEVGASTPTLEEAQRTLAELNQMTPEELVAYLSNLKAKVRTAESKTPKEPLVTASVEEVSELVNDAMDSPAGSVVVFFPKLQDGSRAVRIAHETQSKFRGVDRFIIIGKRRPIMQKGVSTPYQYGAVFEIARNADEARDNQTEVGTMCVYNYSAPAPKSAAVPGPEVVTQ